MPPADEPNVKYDCKSSAGLMISVFLGPLLDDRVRGKARA
jgi:hypothetical protein